MSERINNTPYAPAVHLAYRHHRSGAGVYCALEHSVRIGNGQDHPDRAAAERFRTEIVMLRRFVAQSELRAVDRKPCDDGPIRGVNAEDFSRSERQLVKRNGLGALPN
jgi:hypothetical protein